MFTGIVRVVMFMSCGVSVGAIRVDRKCIGVWCACPLCVSEVSWTFLGMLVAVNPVNVSKKFAFAAERKVDLQGEKKVI